MKTKSSQKYMESIITLKHSIDKILYTKEFLDSIEITADTKGEVLFYRVYKNDGKVVMY